jgi:glutamate--cysteine ligase
MRGADAGPWAQICALPELWSGLLYDDQALDAADRIITGWSAADRESLYREAPRGGLKTPFRGRTVRELALEMLELSRAGLERRQRLNSTGENESYLLATLFEAAHTGKTSAERLLERYATEWHDGVDPIYHEMAY